MPYSKTNWVNNTTPINATNLNKVEQGIADAEPHRGTTAPTSPTLGRLWEDTNTTPATLKAWNGSSWEVLTGSADSTAITPEDYGYTGSDLTADTAAIQAAINAIGTGDSWGSRVYFQPGEVYRINGTITIPQRQRFRIYSEGAPGAKIAQTTPNIPIFDFRYINTWGFEIDHLEFTYETQSTTSDTNAYVMRFTENTLTSNGSGQYHGHIHNCIFSKYYRGISVQEDTGKWFPLWNIRFNDLRFHGGIGAAISIWSLGAGGNPENRVDHCFVENYGASGVYNVEAQMRFKNCNDMVISNIGLEASRTSRTLHLDSCTAVIDGVHFENGTHTGAPATGVITSVLDIANGTVSCRNLRLVGQYTDTSGRMEMIRTGTSTRVYLENCTSNMTATGGRPIYWIGGTASSETWVRIRDYFKDDGPAIPYFDTDFGGTGLTQLVRRDYDTVSGPTTVTAGLTLLKTTANAAWQKITAASPITLTSVPTLLDGYSGQVVTFINTGTNAITFQDQGTLTGSNIRLNGGGTRALAQYGQLKLRYDSTVGDWVEEGGGAGSSASAASETVAGIAEIATQAETTTGTDDARMVTPLKHRVDSDARYHRVGGYYPSLLEQLTLPTGVKAVSHPRNEWGTGLLTTTSGTLYLSGIPLPSGMEVANIQFMSGSTAMATPSNMWFGLFNSARGLLAVSADQTTGGTWAANTLKSLAIAAATTLSAAITTTTQTSITVASASGFPTQGNFVITIGTEELLVTAGQGTTTWTVTRGYNGTTAGTPASGTAVTLTRFVVGSDALYYTGFVVVATTMPNIRGYGVDNNSTQLTPRLSGSSNTAQTTPPVPGAFTANNPAAVTIHPFTGVG